MATNSYYWYIRQGPNSDAIGIVGTDGAAVDSDLEVVLNGDVVNADLTFAEDEQFDLPEEFILDFVGGVLHELGIPDRALQTAYDKALRLYRGKKVSHRYSGDRLVPINLRNDKYLNTREPRDD
jgi:hypothetical protein